MPTSLERATSMKAVLNYADADLAAVQSSMGLLVLHIGELMAAISGQLLKGAGEEHLFGDDPEAAESFGAQLSDFVMKATASKFTPEYCEYVASLPDRVTPRPSMSAMVATVGVISTWISNVLATQMRNEPEKLAKMLTAWQKLLAVNLELLLTRYAD